MTFTLRDSAALALGLMLLAPAGAHAADVGADYFLRGGQSGGQSGGSVQWDGVNFGVHMGVGTINTDFGNSTSQHVAYILRNTTVENEMRPSQWTALPSTVSNGRSYGAFLGYSVQYEELVIGFDLAYNRTSAMENSASDGLSRIVTTSDNTQHIVTVDAAASNKLIDYATFRARAGYAFGQFLPYAFVGGAVARFNYATSATVTDRWTPQGGATVNFGPLTEGRAKDNAIVGGFTAGLGLDVALLPNVFLRGEWEYVGFFAVNGIRTSMNTARVGVGVRF